MHADTCWRWTASQRRPLFAGPQEEEQILLAMYNGQEGAFQGGAPACGCPCNQSAACTGHRTAAWDQHLASAPPTEEQRELCGTEPGRPGCTAQVRVDEAAALGSRAAGSHQTPAAGAP
jgi:hypothetical protein